MRDTYDDGAKCTWESWNREQVRRCRRVSSCGLTSLLLGRQAPNFWPASVRFDLLETHFWVLRKTNRLLKLG